MPVGAKLILPSTTILFEVLFCKVVTATLVMSHESLDTKIKVAVLTVSDRASLPDSDPDYDKSGPAIQELLADNPAFSFTYHAIVPDDISSIQDAVKKWVNDGVDWIVTTGGTGFSPRDRTPEAITPLLSRLAPGLVHLLVSSSLKYTMMAALSRPVAGTIARSSINGSDENSESLVGRETLVVTLPGSMKAVRENLTVLLDSGVIVHAVELMKGGDGTQSGQGVHGALEPASPHHGQGHGHGHKFHRGDHRHDHDHGHGHGHERGRGRGGKHFHGEDHHRHHHHHHQDDDHEILSHDPSGAVSARHRTSPYPIVSLEDAQEIIHKTVNHLPVVTLPVTASLRGHVLAEDVYAFTDFPPTKTTSVDGYALRASDPAGTYTVLTSSSHPHLLSPTSQEELPEGCIYRINTGGALPRGADTVIMVEDTKVVATYLEGPSDSTPSGPPGEEWKVETLIPAPPSRINVRQPGSDVRQGDLVMRRGERITSGGGEVGSLIFIGKREVKVFQKPVVALMSTGNEIRDILGSVSSSAESGEGDWKSWDTNRPSLTAALEGMGYEVVDLGIVPDEIDAHVQTLQDGLARADIVLTTGGTSMGPTDLLKPVIERRLGGEVKFGRVSIKPGKPTTFAVVPIDAPNSSSGDTPKRLKPLFALPGNPASALVTFNVFVVPALRKLGGWEFSGVGCELPRVSVELQQPVLLDPRTEFHRVILRSDLREGGKLKAYSTGGQRSSRVASLSGANGLLVLPQKVNGGKDELGSGEMAEAIVIGEILNLYDASYF
ncbi:MoaB/Mog domain-containing protein [Lentinula detonsa]|uniref:MoaB/Mog domain-containing protein n=1 Tax=Lentinula detonsa TaxID=2804962 RepID=A0AA38Q5G5_9AGAR|nr:MoaB/Mog domain-containing protein [Lentinula detonsa]